MGRNSTTALRQGGINFNQLFIDRSKGQIGGRLWFRLQARGNEQTQAYQENCLEFMHSAVSSYEQRARRPCIPVRMLRWLARASRDAEDNPSAARCATLQYTLAKFPKG